MIISIVLTAFTIYLLCGLIFALVFVLKGADKIDEGAKDSTIGFKIIIIPGCTIFWPLLLNKWVKSKNNHHD